MNENMGRRRFLKMAGIGASSVGAAAAFAHPSALFAQDMTEAAPVTQTEDADAMDAMHGAGIQTFLDNVGKDPDFWRSPMEYTMDGDVKVFNFTVQEIQWETMPGSPFPAMAFNGIVPGPEIRVTEGDKVRFVVNNQMTQSTGVHWHGLIVPNEMDGVPFLTQPPIKPGETFNYEFTVQESRNPFLPLASQRRRTGVEWIVRARSSSSRRIHPANR